MEAYSILMTVCVFSLFFVCFMMAKQKEKQAGRLIWSDQLKAGRYKVVAKSACGTLAILETDRYDHIGLKTCDGELPAVGKTFQWKVKKLKGYVREAVLFD